MLAKRGRTGGVCRRRCGPCVVEWPVTRPFVNALPTRVQPHILTIAGGAAAQKAAAISPATKLTTCKAVATALGIKVDGATVVSHHASLYTSRHSEVYVWDD